VINPDQVVEQYGADTLRVYEMFMGPLERDKPWSTTAIEGVYRFLQRAWRVFMDDDGKSLIHDQPPTQDDLKITHKTIQKVTEDIEALRFNTAISQMMIWVNHMTKLRERPRECARLFVQLLNPFAPHVAEELWRHLGENTELTFASWPGFDPALAKDDTITIAIQVLGKTRATVQAPAGADQQTVEKLAREDAAVQRQLEGKQIKKVIFVPNKIMNFVVG
jgi:leucyl-tRNA synthetase